MIDQTFGIAPAANAAPVNVIPPSFNPVPEDGFLEVWAVLDPVASPNTPALLSVTLGGATPMTPLQPSAIRVNTDGIFGAGPAESDKMLGRQGVRKGTNSQITLQGGSSSQTGRIRVRFMTGEELAAGAGAVA